MNMVKTVVYLCDEWDSSLGKCETFRNHSSRHSSFVG